MLLAEALGVPHLSTGDALRRVAEDDTDAGVRIRAVLESGELVADDDVASVVARQVPHPERGVVLDGFPRTGRQCELLAELWGSARVDLAVELDVPVGEVVRRLGQRRLCPRCGAVSSYSGPAPSACRQCGATPTTRADDRPDIIQRRVWEHERSIEAVRTWYQRHARLVSVDGVGTAEEVATRMLAALGQEPSGSSLLPVT
jgi:adenylate kinase